MTEDLALGLSPIVQVQNGGYTCTIECEDHTYRFEFEQPISHVVVLADTGKRSQEENK